MRSIPGLAGTFLTVLTVQRIHWVTPLNLWISVFSVPLAQVFKIQRLAMSCLKSSLNSNVEWMAQLQQVKNFEQFVKCLSISGIITKLQSFFNPQQLIHQHSAESVIAQYQTLSGININIKTVCQDLSGLSFHGQAVLSTLFVTPSTSKKILLFFRHYCYW